MRPRAPIDDVATLPALLAQVLASFSCSSAFNWREAGYWRHLSTEEFCGQVRRFALGLHRLGLKKGETVGILASPSPHWLIADFAIMCAGGVSVPLFPNLSPDHLEFESRNAGLAYLVAIGEEPARVAAEHPRLWRRVIVRGGAAAERATLPWQALLEMGDAVSDEDPALFARLRDSAHAEDVATIIHTSGSTGKPKGVVLTHGNLLMQIRGAAALFPLDPAQDRALSCLPLAHVFERMVMCYYVAAGIGVWFVDDVKKVGDHLREVKPTVMTMVPRLAEKLHLRISETIDTKGGFGGALGRWAMRLADAPPDQAGIAHGFADKLVYGKLRDALGGRLKYLIMGGAPLSPEITRFLLNIGAPLYIGYGLTETSPCVACNAPGARREGTVGKPWPGVEVRIGANDEIQVRGAGIMRGYHRDAQATAAVIDRDGWLHTGDCGRIDADGYLIITGRLKELFKTSNGKYVTPVPIEHGLAAGGLVEQAMVVAEGRPYVTALLFATPDALARARQRLGCAAMDERAFLASDALRRAIDAEVERVNAGLDQWQQVRRWRLVPHGPTVESDELTPTLKLKRHVVCARYAHEIESMYGPAPVEPAAQGAVA